MKAFFAFLLLIASFQANAKMPIEVVATTEDSVGRRLVYSLKENIRKSSSLEISLDKTETRMQVQIVTLDSDPKNPGNSTVYSLVLTWVSPDQPLPYFLQQYSGYCGSSRVDACADELVAEVSKHSDEIIKIIIQSTKR